MDYKTKHELIASSSHFPVAILGNPATADFELIALGATELRADLSDIRATERGLRHIATVGFVDGAPQTALEEPLDEPTITALAQAYIAHVEAALSTRVCERRN